MRILSSTPVSRESTSLVPMVSSVAEVQEAAEAANHFFTQLVLNNENISKLINQLLAELPDGEIRPVFIKEKSPFMLGVAVINNDRRVFKFSADQKGIQVTVNNLRNKRDYDEFKKYSIILFDHKTKTATGNMNLQWLPSNDASFTFNIITPCNQTDVDQPTVELIQQHYKVSTDNEYAFSLLIIDENGNLLIPGN